MGAPETTYFAPAERATDADLKDAIELVCRNPVIDGILAAVQGMAAVLNEHRQILTVNNALAEMSGASDAASVLGLRPGEALKCVHAFEEPGGCGTSRSCATCGAVIAILASLASHRVEQRKCVATLRRDGAVRDLCMQVRAAPLLLGGRRIILLFLQDVSVEEWRTANEEVFFHDVNNIISGLVGMTFMMDYKDDHGRRDMVKPLQRMAARLSREVKIQDVLSRADARIYRPDYAEVTVEQIFRSLKDFFRGHPIAEGKRIITESVLPGLTLVTDETLVVRVLTNMLKNALEATNIGDEIRFWSEQKRGTVHFRVWNRAVIAEQIALRIFQRYFSTKDGSGRGFGTYAMKLFGEQVLGGKVDFSTSERDGTVFQLALPVLPYDDTLLLNR